MDVIGLCIIRSNNIKYMHIKMQNSEDQITLKLYSN